MSNYRLIWPTPEQLRRRYELMDRMMQKRGVDADAAPAEASPRETLTDDDMAVEYRGLAAQ